MNHPPSWSATMWSRLGAAYLAVIALGAITGASAADATAASPMKTDALRIFARQAPDAPPADGGLAVIGSYIWSGRADINYRPFFQWELRLRAGKTAIDGLKGRITTFDFHHKALVTGDWQTLPAIPAGKTVDPSFHLNCMTFAAWQLELTWNGGAGTWIAGDKVNLPALLDDQDGCAMVVNASSEPGGPTSGPGPVTATFTVWNVGKKPAKGVTVTLHFRDAGGKEVLAVVHHPKPDPIPPGAAQDETEVVKRVPSFATMGLSCEQATVGGGGAINDPGFTKAKDIEIAFIKPVGKTVKAKVRNGYDTVMTGVVVHLGFKDKSGASVGEGDIPVNDLKPGEIRDIAGDIALSGPFVECETGWSTVEVGRHADAPAAGGDATGAAAAPGADDPATAATPAATAPGKKKKSQEMPGPM